MSTPDLTDFVGQRSAFSRLLHISGHKQGDILTLQTVIFLYFAVLIVALANFSRASLARAVDEGKSTAHSYVS